jgi:SAM-dependent methyltransferase
MNTGDHWEKVYRDHPPGELSWYQPTPQLSLDLITRAAPSRDADILDVGGGNSTLVDALVEVGYRRLTVLDLSPSALEQARLRLGSAADTVTWVSADLLTAELPHAGYDLWHDRAVFHFLTSAEERRRYVAQVRHAVRPGGEVLVATFAEDGPARCSGLEVARYSADSLHGEFGPEFRLQSSTREDHLTPWGSHQAFVYCVCRFEPRGWHRAAA